MKTIIAGSRSSNNVKLPPMSMRDIEEAAEACPWKITSVVSGGAPGVDRLGERFARCFCLPLSVMRADWELHGKRAGFLRNLKMASVSEALLAVWDGKSPGTKHMIDIAKQRGLRVHVHIPERFKG